MASAKDDAAVALGDSLLKEATSKEVSGRPIRILNLLSESEARFNSSVRAPIYVSPLSVKDLKDIHCWGHS